MPVKYSENHWREPSSDGAIHSIPPTELALMCDYDYLQIIKEKMEREHRFEFKESYFLETVSTH